MNISRLHPKAAFLGILLAIALGVATAAWASHSDYHEYNLGSALTGGGPTIYLTAHGEAYGAESQDDWIMYVSSESTDDTNMGIYGWGEEMCVGQWGATQTGYTSDAESNTTFLSDGLYIEKNKDECMIHYLYCRTSGYHTWFKSGYGSEDAGGTTDWAKCWHLCCGFALSPAMDSKTHQEPLTGRIVGLWQTDNRPELTSRSLEQWSATGHAA